MISLAATILLRRRGYYDALERSNTTSELTDWLTWFAAAVLEAQRRTQSLVAFIVDKARLLDRLRGQLNERQEKALLRVLREGPDGFSGGLSAGNYIAITGASTATATRDLADMVAKGALVRTGERGHARYRADILLRPVAPAVIDARGRVAEEVPHAAIRTPTVVEPLL